MHTNLSAPVHQERRIQTPTRTGAEGFQSVFVNWRNGALRNPEQSAHYVYAGLGTALGSPALQPAKTR